MVEGLKWRLRHESKPGRLGNVAFATPGSWARGLTFVKGTLHLTWRLELSPPTHSGLARQDAKSIIRFN